MTKMVKIALSLTCSLWVLASFKLMHAIERSGAEPYSEEVDTRSSYQEEERKQVLTKELLTALKDVQKLAEAKAPRPDGVCATGIQIPTQPVSSSSVFQQLKCILCQLKSLIGRVDNQGTYLRLLNEIECGCCSGYCPPSTMGDAIATLAKALTEILSRLGCPECCDNDLFPIDIFGELCYTSSQIAVIDAKIDVITTELVITDSMINNVQNSVNTINTKVDNVTTIVEDIRTTVTECCSVIGSRADTVDCEFVGDINDCATINDTNLSVIQWLKAIFVKCNQIQECACVP